MQLKNLCTFATQGAKATVHPEVKRIISEIVSARKPLGLICISPAIGALLFGEQGVNLTIGNDSATANVLTELGALHVDCPVEGIVEDPSLRIVSTPAYMLGQNIGEVAEGISGLVRTVLSWS